MLSVKKAQRLVLANVKKGQAGRAGLLDSVGRILADDILSPEDLPRFDQSAMDGYAVRSEDLGSPKLKRSREIFAGGALAPALSAGECAYITTGAIVPSNAGAVMPVEDVLEETGFIRVRTKAGKGDNIRPAGDDVRKGALIAGKGTLLTPQSVGIFCALGISRLKVFLPPAVGILTTGSEVEAIAVRRLAKNKIRNSNLCGLTALLRPAGVEPAFAENLEDRPGRLTEFLGKLKKLPEIVILTGGVSVGGHDYVKQELEESGVRSLFWKVAQKPGKPMYAGVKNGTLFLGLPGNPAAAITCFYLYALPAINRYMGRGEIFLRARPALLTGRLKAGGSRTLFLRGYFKDGKVEPLRGQGSHMLSPFLKTNCFIELKPSGPRVIKKGEKVRVLLLN
ncbi:MAG: molybdopterin molybdotransferase MoeA [Elusimicrobiota bacterium]|nr:molybdopterin molybdotransferase MoeA [Elusimicrobiota bacterium]